MLFLRNKKCFAWKIFLVLGSTLFLTACDKPITYSYLIQHPNMLKKELDNCRLTNVNTRAQKERCEIVLYAVATLTSLINQMQENPEKYGQNILDQEIVCVKMKTAYQELQKTLASLNKKTAPSADRQVVKIKLDQAGKKYQEQKEKVEAMLAVAGMRRPE
jgi:hypothetical protein